MTWWWLLNELLNYTDSSLRLDDTEGMVDHAIQIKNARVNDKNFVIIVNLHENRVVIIEYYDKETKADGEVIEKVLHQKRIYYERNIYNDDNVYERLNKDDIYSHGSRRVLNDKVKDYLGYSFYDKYVYFNTSNGDPLSPWQVAHAIVWDFTQLLKEGIL